MTCNPANEDLAGLSTIVMTMTGAARQRAATTAQKEPAMRKAMILTFAFAAMMMLMPAVASAQYRGGGGGWHGGGGGWHGGGGSWHGGGGGWHGDSHSHSSVSLFLGFGWGG